MLIKPSDRVWYFPTQERLVLSILPRFVALEMIADMSSLENELNPHEFHKIYIHQYKDVRYTLVLLCMWSIKGLQLSSHCTLVPQSHNKLTLFFYAKKRNLKTMSLFFAASFLQTSRVSLCCPWTCQHRIWSEPLMSSLDALTDWQKWEFELCFRGVQHEPYLNSSWFSLFPDVLPLSHHRSTTACE